VKAQAISAKSDASTLYLLDGQGVPFIYSYAESKCMAFPLGHAIDVLTTNISISECLSVSVTTVGGAVEQEFCLPLDSRIHDLVAEMLKLRPDWQRMDVLSDDGALLEQSLSLKEHSRLTIRGKFEVAESPALVDIATSGDGSEIWAVSRHGAIYYCGYHSSTWQRIPGSLRSIAVSADGWHVWGINSSNELFHRSGYWGSWARVPGHSEQVCVSTDGLQVWTIDRHHSVWTCKAQPDIAEWLPNLASEISS